MKELNYKVGDRLYLRENTNVIYFNNCTQTIKEAYITKITSVKDIELDILYEYCDTFYGTNNKFDMRKTIHTTSYNIDTYNAFDDMYVGQLYFFTTEEMIDILKEEYNDLSIRNKLASAQHYINKKKIRNYNSEESMSLSCLNSKLNEDEFQNLDLEFLDSLKEELKRKLNRIV